jgi:hypothetical protein
VSVRVRLCPSSLASAVGVIAPLDANSWRRSLVQVSDLPQSDGAARSRWRCCTCALYDSFAWASWVRPETADKSLRGASS